MKKVLLTLFSFASLAQAQASVHITWEQVGDDVRISYSGSFDLSSYTLGSSDIEALPLPNSYLLTMDQHGLGAFPQDQNIDIYYLLHPPTSTSLGTLDSSAAGAPTILFEAGTSPFGFGSTLLDDSYIQVGVPTGYANGESLGGSLTIEDITLAELNADAFDNTLAFDDGTNQVTYTTIPEPASALLLGLTTLGFLHRRRSFS
ncbi:MAG: PEP-CTERM sorting domain-containing protein [Verrucomicrobiales bacterium]